jgi:predicted ATPase/class 3 adenylate cyclase
VTFLFTDVAGSTRLAEQHPQAMRYAEARLDTLLRGAIAAHGGHVFRPTGDGVCAVFATAPDATSAALAAQRALAAEPWGEIGPVSVRMALHTGAAELRAGDYFGLALNRAARLRDAAHGRQVVLSEATAVLVRDAPSAGASLRDLGEHRLRDLARPERVFQLTHPDLPADFPPLRSLGILPHNLPLQLTSFVGRERELATVARLLATQRLVTLTGPGGVGKTRLALQAAADALDAFADGAWLIDLAPLAEPGLVPQAVASVLGVREERGRTLMATLTAALQARRMLLMLDNCEHLTEECARLADALLRNCPNVWLLATSREPLGITGETLYRLTPLGLPDEAGEVGPAPPPEGLAAAEAVRLFVERALAVQPGFAVTARNAAAVARVCRRLDGLPLAIELAAARLRALSVADLASLLEDRFRLLTGGSRAASPRQQTLRATVEWSYTLLSARERRLFERLAVFAAGWTLEAATDVCASEGPVGVERHEVLDLLLGLVDRSLVAAEPAADGATRYRLLETVRQYALERLRESGQLASVRDRHLDRCARLVEAAQAHLGFFLPDAETEAWLGPLERELDNLRAAVTWSLEGRESERGVEAGLRLACGLHWFWVTRGHFTEGRTWLARLLERSGPAPAALRARALATAGYLACWHGDFETARRPLAESLDLSRALDDRPAIALALHGLGFVAEGEGDNDRARSCFEGCLEVAGELRDRWLMAFALHFLGHGAYHRGAYGLARSLLEESIALCLEMGGNKSGVAFSRQWLARVARAQGDEVGARDDLAEGLRLFRELGDQRGIAYSLIGAACAAVAQGQAERAARLFGAADRIRAVAGPFIEADLRLAYERDVAAGQDALGEAAFAAAWAEGEALPLEEAIAYALDEPQPAERGNGEIARRA